MNNERRIENSDDVFTVSMLIYSASLYDYYSWWLHSQKSDHVWALSAHFAIWIMTFVTYTSDVGILIFLVRNVRRLVVKKHRQQIRQKTRAWFSSEPADNPWTTAIYIFMGVLLANVPISCLGYVFVHVVFYGTFASFITEQFSTRRRGSLEAMKKLFLQLRVATKIKKLGP